MPKHHTEQQQIEALKRVVALVAKSECNCAIRVVPGDVCSLSAVDTPNASEIVNAVGTYDLWKGGNLIRPDISAEDAARIVVAEYLAAKADRIHARRPDIPRDAITEVLLKGYQKPV